MKEEEAKTKLCPKKFEFCQGSDCMMWVTSDNEYYPSTGDKQGKSYSAGDCGLKSKELECRGF